MGSNIIEDVCRYLKQLGYKKIRIGKDKENTQSTIIFFVFVRQVHLETNYI
ncbi:MAG: hypothetical protein SOU07_06090 [Bacilli bacterium]|nr:hypothetical protein [Bacilli bacterium]